MRFYVLTLSFVPKFFEISRYASIKPPCDITSGRSTHVELRTRSLCHILFNEYPLPATKPNDTCLPKPPRSHRICSLNVDKTPCCIGKPLLLASISWVVWPWNNLFTESLLMNWSTNHDFLSDTTILKLTREPCCTITTIINFMIPIVFENSKKTFARSLTRPSKLWTKSLKRLVNHLIPIMLLALVLHTNKPTRTTCTLLRLKTH